MATQELNRFLNRRCAKQGDVPTHTAFGASRGSWAIADEDIPQFFALYSAALNEGARLQIVEKGLAPPSRGLPLLVDFDLSVPLGTWGEGESEPLYDAKKVVLFMDLLRNAYTHYTDLPRDRKLKFHVLLRPSGYKSGDDWSDGVHIQCRELWAPPEVHRVVRGKVLGYIERVGDSLSSDFLGLHSAVDRPDAKVWDEAVLGDSAAWLMLGSSKHYGKNKEPLDAPAYQRVSVFTWTGEGWSELGVREKKRPSFEAITAGAEPVLPNEAQHALLVQELSLRCPPSLPLLSLKGHEHEPYCSFGKRHEGECSPECSTCVECGKQFCEGCGGLEDGCCVDCVAASASEEPVVEGVQASEVSPALVEALVGCLSQDRVERKGMRKGPEGKGATEVCQAICYELGPSGMRIAQEFVMRSDYWWHSGSEERKQRSIYWFTKEAYILPKNGVDHDIRQLRRWAKEDDPVAYAAVCAAHPSRVGRKRGLTADGAAKLVNEITGLTPDPKVKLIKDKDGKLPFSHRYLFGPSAGLDDLTVFLPAVGRQTTVISSHLGTGKTRIFEAIACLPRLKIIYIAGRRSFTRHAMKDFGEKLGFANYLDLKSGSIVVSKHPRIFVQVESLRRLVLVKGDAYDVVIMDESETVLAALSPGLIRGADVADTVDTFHALIHGARIVIAGDAFVSDRTIEVLKLIRPPATTPFKLLLNEYNPYERVCERIVVREEDKTGKEVEKFKMGKAHFHASLKAALLEGKRIVLVSGSRDEGRTLEDDLFDNDEFRDEFKAARGHEFKHVFYHSENADRDKKNKEFGDVETYWSKVDVLMYTPTITVGINYDPADEAQLFDQLYLYGTRKGATVRDMFQASLRVRKLRDNKMVFFLSLLGPSPSLTGYGAIATANERTAASLGETRKWLTKRLAVTKEALSKKRGTNADAVALKQLETDEVLLSHSEKAWPAWYLSLLVRNQNEVAVCQTLPEEVYALYLARCGYTTSVLADFEDDGLALVKPEDLLPFKDLAVLSEDEFKRLDEMSRRDDGVFSQEERQALVKAKYMRKVGLDVEVWPEWATEDNVEALWQCFSNKAKQHLFKHAALEKAGAAGLAKAARMDMWDGIAQGSYNRRHKLQLVMDVCAAAGLAHSCEEKAWSFAEITELLPIFEDKTKGQSLNDRMVQVFRLRRERVDKDGSHSAQVRLMSDIGSVLCAWVGTEVSSSKKQVRSPAPGSPPQETTAAEFQAKRYQELMDDDDFATEITEEMRAHVGKSGKPLKLPKSGVVDKSLKSNWASIQAAKDWAARGGSPKQVRHLEGYTTKPAVDGLLWDAVVAEK